jgi:hypothetical protein
MFDSGKTARLEAAKDQEVNLFLRDKRNRKTEKIPGILEDVFCRHGMFSYLRFKKKTGGLSVVIYFSGGEYEIAKIEDAASQEVLYAGI